MQQPVEVTVEQGLATLKIGRAHGNAINERLVDELIDACRRIEPDRDIRGVLFTGAGKLFSPGLDLQELGELDRPGMERFIERLNACILMLYTMSKPVVAAIQGHAIAGGCVLTLTADWRVLRQGALVGLNEVRVGVPFPFGVSMILRETVPRQHLEEVALFGRNYSDAAAVEAGLVHEVLAPDRFEAGCRERLEELAAKDPNAFGITKRYLRSATVERIRANDLQFTREFLDAWFTEGTRRRIASIVEELKKPTK